MTNKHWITKRIMPRLPFGENGEGWGKIAEANLKNINPEKAKTPFCADCFSFCKKRNDY